MVKTSVVPVSRPTRAKVAITSSPAAGSRLAAGSSARIRRGSATSARAIATRCDWPPDSEFGAAEREIGEADQVERVQAPAGATAAGANACIQ